MTDDQFVPAVLRLPNICSTSERRTSRGVVFEGHLPDQLVEIDWDLRFKSDSLPVVRMVEGNRSGMQRQARMIAIPTAIFLIANHRMADAGEMDAKLVLPARQEIEFQQCEVFGLLEHPIGRTR